jgi:hypothetical protein
MTPLDPRKDIRHAWREPIYGAMENWRRFWYFRIGWTAILAAAVALVKGLRQGDLIVAAHAFPLYWLFATLLVGVYAFVQRIVELYDDRIFVRQGRGGDTFKYSEIESVLVKSEAPHPSILLCLASGKRQELFLAPEFAADAIVSFLSGRNVKCTGGIVAKPNQPNQSPDPTLASGTSPAGQEPRHR